MDYATLGSKPKGSLIQGTDGNYYGTTYEGGTGTHGTIFKMDQAGLVAVIKHLSSASTGRNPSGSLVEGSDGYLYGMASSGGTNNLGTVFKLKKDGTMFTVLKHLDNTSGHSPQGSMIKGADGNLYGMLTKGGSGNAGTIFKITATTGLFSVLKPMATATGSLPYGNLVQGTDGAFYGMARQGGSSGYGTIFKLNATGTTLTVVKHLATATTGGYPEGSLVQGSDGTLYGMTTQGGINAGGTIFKITTAAVPAFAVLRHLKPATDGGTPSGSLVIQKPNPKAIAQSITTAEDVSKVITLTGSGGTPLSFAITIAPKNGTLTGSGAARTYKPNANYYGKDSFYFTATWGCQTSVAAKVNITVTPVADAITSTSSTLMSNQESMEEIEQSRLELSLTALPNPSASSFTLVPKGGSGEVMQLRVLDALGRVVEARRSVLSNKALQVGHHYRSGIYFAEVIQGGQKATKQLLKRPY
jgi:uncharacterized repeat protein (TIGR03803 family)